MHDAFEDLYQQMLHGVLQLPALHQAHTKGNFLNPWLCCTQFGGDRQLLKLLSCCSAIHESILLRDHVAYSAVGWELPYPGAGDFSVIVLFTSEVQCTGASVPLSLFSHLWEASCFNSLMTEKQIQMKGIDKKAWSSPQVVCYQLI